MAVVQQKPSEILEAMPREKWTRGAYCDANGRYCGAGYVASCLGLSDADLRYDDSGNMWAQAIVRERVVEIVADTYEIDAVHADDLVCEMVNRNDLAGLDTVIAYLKELGL